MLCLIAFDQRCRSRIWRISFPAYPTQTLPGVFVPNISKLLRTESRPQKKIFGQVGEIVAYDALINNVDRIPLLWDNEGLGNPGSWASESAGHLYFDLFCVRSLFRITNAGSSDKISPFWTNAKWVVTVVLRDMSRQIKTWNTFIILVVVKDRGATKLSACPHGFLSWKEMHEQILPKE